MNSTQNNDERSRSPLSPEADPGLPVGYVCHGTDEEALSSYDDLVNAMRFQLPSDLPAGMAPTLLPNDRVIITPLDLEKLTLGSPPVYVALSQPKQGYAVGRIVGQDSQSLTLRYDAAKGPSVQLKRSHILSVWAIRLLVHRQIA